MAGLYASALYVGAAHDLAGLHRAVGDAVGGRRWDDRARLIADGIERHLWQPERGFYRMHNILSWPLPGRAPQDDDRFGMGGNAVALLNQSRDIAFSGMIGHAAHGNGHAFFFVASGQCNL